MWLIFRVAAVFCKTILIVEENNGNGMESRKFLDSTERVRKSDQLNESLDFDFTKEPLKHDYKRLTTRSLVPI